VEHTGLENKALNDQSLCAHLQGERVVRISKGIHKSLKIFNGINRASNKSKSEIHHSGAGKHWVRVKTRMKHKHIVQLTNFCLFKGHLRMLIVAAIKGIRDVAQI
jgi:hypothetical protein